ncbi:MULTISPECIES: co-chaperone YbbN [unclassified Endozoicomonas]|uniref:thioredoxin family protein n=1 Tax=unclassified Endozoicomonas TaxID=2644528 RepID=UPI0021478A98|nr:MULTISPECIES: thioredoxin family protein [unclassified Endozoicomonas]
MSKPVQIVCPLYSTPNRVPKIRSIPTLILFKNGKEIDRTSVALPGNQLKKWIRNAAKS